MSLSSSINEKANLIWAIADKLIGVYKPHEYGEVILPLTVIRRFNCILADTKDAVLAKFEQVKDLPCGIFCFAAHRAINSIIPVAIPSSAAR